jgi:hypothetical protein
MGDIAQRKCDVIFIPAGTIHAIGRGLVVAEPRRCGIATFTTDLQQAISTSCVDVETSIVAMTDHGNVYDIHPSFALRSTMTE